MTRREMRWRRMSDLQAAACFLGLLSLLATMGLLIAWFVGAR